MREVNIRLWKDSDFESFAQMHSDPDVMQYLNPLTRDDAKNLFEYIQNEFVRDGWGIWAVEVDSVFAGMAGLHVPKWEMPFTPCIEALWRFKKKFWGCGVAYEASSQAIRYGFTTAQLKEIVTFTTPANQRSIRLIERLGFRRDERNDFEHPEIEEGNPHQNHIFYRLTEEEHTAATFKGCTR